MSDTPTDRDVLEAAWRYYDEAFADHVGDVVTPDEYVDTAEQVEWAARIFMFGYGLGAVAGARTVSPDQAAETPEGERVERIVEDVVDIHASDEFAMSNAGIVSDFLE